ncbi:MAG: PAS domain S-box protein [Candidatus Marinimicrobia bacterium]|nr:PAS domain S-box protein [Candidatus Neomarinimicrobiota bacterium]
MGEKRRYKKILENLKKISLLVICISIGFNWTYSEVFRVTRFDESDGLPDGPIYSIAQDSDGFIWIGTSTGLCRFDGYSFRRYKIPGISPRPIKTIVGICPVDNENLLIGTSKFGLVLLNREKEIFYPIKPIMLGNIEKVPLKISSIEKNRNGEFLIGTIRKGIYVYNPSRNTLCNLEYVLGRKLNPEGVRIGCVKVDGEGNYYIGAIGAGFIFIDRKTKKLFWFDREHGDFFERVFDIFLDEDGEVWLGTDKGLFKFDRTKKELKLFRLGLDTLNSEAWVISIKGEGNCLYLAVKQVGLLIFDRVKKKFYKPEYVFRDDVHSIPKRINKIFIDKNHNIWLAASDLYILNRPGAFRNVSLERVLGRTESLGVNALRVGRENGVIWIGTDIGVIRYNYITGESKYLDSSIEGRRYSGISSLLVDSQGRLWVGALNGLGYVPLSGGKIVDVLTPVWRAPGLRNLFIHDIAEDSAGNIWAVAMGNGLFRISSDLTHISKFDMREYGIDNYLSSIDIDSEGNLWLGTIKNGLVKFRRDKGVVERYNITTPLKLTGDHVTTVFIDSHGNVWAGICFGGINVISKDGKISYYTTENGLASNKIISIVSSGGVIWVSTKQGLSRIDPEMGDVVNFGYDDGVKYFLKRSKYSGFTKGGADVSKDGMLWFGGPSGLTYFMPDSVFNDSHESDLKVSLVEVIDKKGKKRSFVPCSDTLKFSYKDIYIKLDLTMLDFYDPFKCRYKYRVYGLGEEWINISGTRSITFSNISPGNHIIEILFSDHKGMWCRKAKTLLLNVAPPFYHTWYFRTILVISLILSIVVFIKMSIAAVRAQNLKLEKIVEDRTKELRRKQRELLHAHADLEKKVIERTRQLQELNKKLLKEIEERKLNETLLRESQNITHSLLNTISDSVVMIDTNGKIIALNEAMADCLGINEDDLLGRNVFEFEFFSFSPSFLKEIVKQKKKKVVERSFRVRYYQQYFYPIFDLKGNVTRLVIFSRDITDLKKAEEVLLKHKEALEKEVRRRTRELEKINRELRQEISRRKSVERELRESEEKFRYLIENANDIIWMTDTKGRFLLINKMFECVLGYGKKQVIGRVNIDFVKDIHKEVLKRNFATTLGGKTAECEIKVLTREGKELIFWMKMVPFRDNGKIVGVFGIGRDVTRIKESEKELRMAEARKRESLKEFTLKLAHELKNPLASIKSSAQIVRSISKEKKVSRISRHMDTITRNVDICNRAIKELYDFTHRPEYNFKVISIGSLVDKLNMELERVNELSSNIKARLKVETRDLEILGDEMRLIQAFQNLINNAVESIEGYGEIEIVVREKNGAVEFKFSDTGCGISRENINKIFLPFYSSKATGFGLGLAIVKDVVEMHGGELKVESIEGEGTTFSLIFPTPKGAKAWRKKKSLL